MEHSFDIEIAQKVGVNAAILYKHIQYWCAKNKANDKHFHDGYYWTYNSTKAFSELFPYMTERQIRTALEKLINENLIKKAKYNTQNYDQTLWYTDLTKMSNQDDSNVKPIPYNKQHIVNKDISKDISGDSADNFVFGKKVPKQRKITNTSEYESALLLADNYSNNKELVSELHKLIDMKHEMCGKQRYKFWCSTIQNYLDELDKQFGADDKQKIEAVKLSIRYNATMKVMVPNTYSGNNIDSVTGMKNGVRNAYESEDQSFVEGVVY